jgi:peptidoglycan/xylan/chitin deacetylase (PgdA/CDA1 family)
MSIVKSAVRLLLHQGGGLHVLRHLRSAGVRIFTYHRFHDAASWEAHCRHLRQYYQPVSLAQVLEAVRSNRPLPPRAAAVTVDDGYRDFFSIAFPVVQHYGIPATVFLVTDFLDGRLWLWWDAVRYLLERTTVEHLPEEPGPPVGGAVRVARLLQAIPQWPDRQRHEFMAHLPERLGVPLPAQPPAEYAPLRWDEVRAMRTHGIEFGSHTKTHPILPRVESADVLAEELRHSKQRIEEELQAPVHYFCYPNGDWDHRTVEGVAAAGYGLAVTTQWGRNLRWKSPYLLERSPADPSWPLPYFQEVAAFGYPWRQEAS